MEIEEDDQPYWYLLNCVAGLEMDLLRQVKQLAQDLPQADVVKFVVPTVTKTRSHGANRMVRETKVKYQGYVFAKLRLTRETYEPIRNMDLCRSWMGTINMKGYKKLPPAPLPLSDEEIESFDLENPKWEIDEQDKSTGNDSDGIILDTHENDMKEMEEEEAIEQEVERVYKGLKVEDMIKVTGRNKFKGEDGIVKRLKEEMVLIRFFTYGQTFDEWLDPSDVRKLTDDEVLKGLGGPGKPITQQDLEGPRDRREDKPQRKFDSRNSVGAFGGGPSRERRQDRNERRFGGEMDHKQERENWSQFKENEKRGRRGRSYDDGNGVEFRPASEAEGDVDSQWGRRRRSNQQEDDWSSFVSQGPSDYNKKNKSSPSKEDTDDFFASLMTDLSKDIDGHSGKSRDQPQESSGSDSDDDFFASLMSEINDSPSSQKQKSSTNGGDDDDDFFASLEREIRGSKSATSKPKRAEKETKPDISSAPTADEDDFFASLEMELETDLGESKSQGSEQSADAAEDDFFSSLESELSTDLSSSETIDAPASAKQTRAPQVTSSSEFDASDLKKRTVPELKAILKDRGLKVSGKKADLIERLTSGV
ncbi:unnamed protein product [Pseudo-nitzschia multistriata]|uniref:SAP domain-containing protein n=1 Tax=Pseudo-nitzschia multistriata TaxID=183589 RepID=A0A448ZRP4_9STRA|nr:unnamed protein product [Pseudo-nitzschia multistriata]